MAQSEIAVEIDGLRMRYGSVDVLDDVGLRLHVGEVLALLGPNGAGKTTTVEILEGFRIRSGGRVSVLGEDPARAGQDWRSRVGIVLQSWRDHGKWQVRELLAHQASYYACYDHRQRWDTDELLAAVGLTEQAYTKINKLSGGQRRRLDVAVGLVGGPELIFLDEPTAGLDPVARREFHELIRTIAQRAETTILITTHDLDEAEKLADRIVILAGGRVIAQGTSAELAAEIVGEDEVRWTYQGRHEVRSTRDSTAFARELFARHGEEIVDLEVHRASLEDTYLALIARYESDRALVEAVR